MGNARPARWPRVACASIPARRTTLWRRWRFATAGIVLPIIAINRQTGRMESLPEIVSRGFAVAEDGSDFMYAARQVVANTLEASSREEKTGWGVIKEKIRADLKRYIVKETSRRPLIMPVILEV
jgi:ribonuclease J